LLVVALSLLQPMWAASALPVPATGVYLGVWVDPSLATGEESATENLEAPAPKGIGRPFPLHLIYLQWGDIAAMLQGGVFQPNGALLGDINHGRVPVISWGCDQIQTNSNHLIAGGDPGEDANIMATAQALKQYPGIVMLRWFWEFNQLNKNQTCRGDTGGKPTQSVYNDFIGAWQHIYNVFQSAGATNVVFVWNPGSYNTGASNDPHGYYPGNAYVDWVAVDTYQNGTTSTFVQDFDLFYNDFSQSQYAGKLLMVGENGSPNYSQYSVEAQAAYLQGVLAAIQANRYPLLKAYNYFDSQGTDNKGNFNTWVLDDNNGHGNGGMAQMALLAASASFATPAVLTSGSVANGATYVAGGLVPGSWAQVKGTGLSNVTRIWGASDFTGLGNALPTNLSGVRVTVNNIAAAVYYISESQISFQVPAGISGTASVQAFNTGGVSNTVTAASASSAPGIFAYAGNALYYPSAVFVSDGRYAGNSSLGTAYRSAVPGETVELYATGLETRPAGVIPTPQSIAGVNVTIGPMTVPASYAGQTPYVGEFQINFVVPNLSAGTYPISIQVGSISSPTSINGQPLVIPVQ
jgi:uncharacterized protein (TIGR03437 family)